VSAVRMQQGRRSGRRRWAAASAAAALTLVLTVGAAAPSEAAPKRSTSLSLSSIARVGSGTQVISGGKADLQGKASANLVGKRLTVQHQEGGDWVDYPGSGTVKPSTAYSIRIRVTGVGKQTFRVRYAGSSTLKAATASRSVTVWSWQRLVDVPALNTDGTSSPAAAPQPHTNVLVAGINRKSLLAGDVPAGGTGVTTFEIKKRCSAFRTTVGIGDDSPKAGSITFSVYFDDVAMVVKEPKHGKVAKIGLNAKRVSLLTLRNTEPSPAGAFDAPEVAAWPDAQVLCSVAF
jgi:hypothetical protein